MSAQRSALFTFASHERSVNQDILAHLERSVSALFCYYVRPCLPVIAIPLLYFVLFFPILTHLQALDQNAFVSAEELVRYAGGLLGDAYSSTDVDYIELELDASLGVGGDNDSHYVPGLLPPVMY